MLPVVTAFIIICLKNMRLQSVISGKEIAYNKKKTMRYINFFLDI